MTDPNAPGTIAVTGLSKRFGAVQAVSELSFLALPGRVTGFLGPNGSGKTTTLSIILGLAAPDRGTVTIGGRPYAALERPALTVGSALEAAFHAAHTGRAHLRIHAAAIGVPAARAEELLALVGLAGAADRKAGSYSLGMRQRLALATALLGDPDVLLLDEPINGLDPEGIRWIREFLRALAAQGKTVLLSSHLLSEIEQTVDDVVVIRRGRLAFAGPLAELSRTAGEPELRADAADLAGLAAALTSAGAGVTADPAGLRVAGVTAERLGEIALAAGIPLRHLSTNAGGLEQIFLDLISAADAPPPGVDAAPAPKEPSR